MLQHCYPVSRDLLSSTELLCNISTELVYSSSADQMKWEIHQNEKYEKELFSTYFFYYKVLFKTLYLIGVSQVIRIRKVEVIAPVIDARLFRIRIHHNLLRRIYLITPDHLSLDLSETWHHPPVVKNILLQPLHLIVHAHQQLLHLLLVVSVECLLPAVE